MFSEVIEVKSVRFGGIELDLDGLHDGEGRVRIVDLPLPILKRLILEKF